MMPTPKTQQFIKQMEDYGIQGGLTRSAARVLGYLTISQPARQSAEDIQRHLSLSSGSVSTAVTVLYRAGLVERTKGDGDRRHYYELNPDGWKRATLQQFKMLEKAIELAETGLKSSPGNARLIAMRDIFILFDEAFQPILKRLEN